MYRRIQATIWNNPKIQQLSTEAKLVYLYLYTSDTTTPAGTHRLNPRVIDAELGTKDAASDIAELKAIGLVKVFSHTILIPSFHREQRQNPNFTVSALKFIKDEEEDVKKEFVRLYSEEVSQALAAAKLKKWEEDYLFEFSGILNAQSKSKRNDPDPHYDFDCSSDSHEDECETIPQPERKSGSATIYSMSTAEPSAPSTSPMVETVPATDGFLQRSSVSSAPGTLPTIGARAASFDPMPVNYHDADSQCTPFPLLSLKTDTVKSNLKSAKCEILPLFNVVDIADSSDIGMYEYSVRENYNVMKKPTVGDRFILPDKSKSDAYLAFSGGVQIYEEVSLADRVETTTFCDFYKFKTHYNTVFHTVSDTTDIQIQNTDTAAAAAGGFLKDFQEVIHKLSTSFPHFEKSTSSGHELIPQKKLKGRGGEGKKDSSLCNYTFRISNSKPEDFKSFKTPKERTLKKRSGSNNAKFTISPEDRKSKVFGEGKFSNIDITDLIEKYGEDMVYFFMDYTNYVYSNKPILNHGKLLKKIIEESKICVKPHYAKFRKKSLDEKVEILLTCEKCGHSGYATLNAGRVNTPKCTNCDCNTKTDLTFVDFRRLM